MLISLLTRPIVYSIESLRTYWQNVKKKEFLLASTFCLGKMSFGEAGFSEYKTVR